MTNYQKSHPKVKFADRLLPDYTRGEEIFNTVSHVVGAAFGVIALVLTVVFSALRANPWSVIASAVYGGTMILLYTVSSIYHGLRPNMGKRVMQVIDHCTIFLLIAGSIGPFGVVLFVAFVLYYLLSSDAFGTPMLAPFSPLIAHDLRDSVVKYDLQSLTTRPQFLNSKNKTRLAKKEEKKDE